MELNHEKCHWMCIDKYADQGSFTFEDLCLTNWKEEVILSQPLKINSFYIKKLRLYKKDM